MHDRLKAISLFSGIGGLDLAAEAAGIEPVLFCEIEPYPCEILEKRWPDVDNAGNVKAFANKLLRDLGGSPYERFRVPSDYAGTVDVVYGGFPCQDLSCAGKQAGLSGERSGLWFEMLRVVREIRPRWVVAENVRGAVNLALDTVCAGLEDEGYVVWPFVLPAAAFGAPHRRERLFVVAARGDVADALNERLQGSERAGALCESGPSAHESVAECGARLWPTPRGSDGTHGGPNQRGSRGDLMLSSAVALWPTSSVKGNHNRRGASKTSGDGLATAVNMWPTPHRNCSNGAGEHGDGGKNIQTAVMWPTFTSSTATLNDMHQAKHAGDGDRPKYGDVPGGTLSPAWVEILMGFPLGWTDIDCNEPEPWPGWPAGMGAEQFDYEPPRTCGKIPNRAKRLKCLGNAVVPQQFAAFFEAIREAETCVDTSITLPAIAPRYSP